MQRIIKNFRQSKRPIMKIAQLLSMFQIFYQKNMLRNLQTSTSAHPWDGTCKRRMKNELGDEWLDYLMHLKRNFCCCILGQVHKASFSGRKLFVIQYPDMLSIVEADIGQLKLLFSIYKKIDPTIDTSEIQKEISSRVREELDYTLNKTYELLALFSKKKKFTSLMF